MAGCPSSHQPTRIREEMLESGEPLQRKLNFRLCTLYCFSNIDTRCLHSSMVLDCWTAKGLVISSPIRKMEVAGVRCKRRNRKTWKECVGDDMKVLGLHSEWTVFRDVWRDFISLTLA